MEVVEKMLALAKVNSSDVVYDLGSGDGRIVIMAGQKYGARAFGFEIDPKLVRESRENVRRAGVEHLVEIRQQDIMTADLSGATVVTMFLLPAANLMLRPKLLRELKTGARVVSNEHNMGDWKPDRILKLLVFWFTYLLVFSWLPLVRILMDGETYIWGTTHFSWFFRAAGSSANVQPSLGT